ncbi:MAG: DUF72 domain-containing protein [Myxococcaceae bacterium]|nr:DUF72 domain-containing protein [Myxococcaceae bacterium]
MAFHLGTSGFSYPHWAEIFYAGIPPRRWLEHYAKAFSTVELNSTFYRLPTPEVVDGWRDHTPRGFVFAVKGSRFLTHMKRLLDRGPGIDRFFAVVNRLGPKLGPVLWQLSPQMKKADPRRLDDFLAALPRHTRHVFEFRSEAWYVDEVFEVLDRHRAAICEHDLLPRPPPVHTGAFRYVRFHGTTGRYQGRYGKRALRPWARDLRAWCARHDAWVYFNNDLHGHALMDAMDLSELMGAPVDPSLHPSHAPHGP